ncbi:hypothetical protein EU546_06215 [Candidatus Thorarchaeota archaeon]|nr:MAG: hypothetical protein EU546_06215 [Candidatus Thorarchaeota archaeon]
MDRTIHALDLGLALALIVILIGTCQGETPAETVIDDHKIIQDEHLVINTTLTIVDGGWLEVRGSTLVFDNSIHGENIINVEYGGALTIGPSSNDPWTLIEPLNDTASTWISIDRASRVRIENLSIRSSFEPAISIDGTANPVILNSTFLNCRYGINLQGCTGAAVKGNSFLNCSRTAIDMRGVTGGTIYQNHIQGYVGVRLSTSRFVTIGSNSLNISRRGVSSLHCDNMVIEGNIFSVTGGWACDLEFTTVVAIKDNGFQGAIEKDPSTSGLLSEWSAFIRVEGCTFNRLSRGIRMENFAGQSGSHNNVTDNSFTDCHVAIEISSSENTLDGNSIRGARTGVSIHPWDDPVLTGNKVFNCIIEECTVGLVVVNSTSTRIGANVFGYNDEDCRFVDAKGVGMWSDRHRNWRHFSINATRSSLNLTMCAFGSGPTTLYLRGGSTAEIHQSTISSVDTAIILTDGSISDLFNTTHGRTYTVDASSTLRVWWDVRISVVHASGHPMDGPCWVKVTDYAGAIVGDYHLEEARPMRTVPVLELMIKNDQQVNRTPHRFDGGSGTRMGGTTEIVDRHRVIVIMLDDIPPAITITSPKDGEVLNTSVALFSGRAEGVDYITITIHIIVDGEPTGDGMGFWHFTEALPDGDHVVTHIASDGHGNNATFPVAFRIDTTPPTVTILEPKSSETLTSVREFTIRGKAAGASRLEVDGKPVPIVSGTFLSTVILDEDGTYVVLLTAFDEVWNNVSYNFIILLDTTAPLLRIDETPTRTREDSVMLTGETSPDDTVLIIEGETINFGPGGRFNHSVTLEEGTNRIEIEARDDAGNSEMTSITIISDRSTYIEILSPINGTTFHVEEIEILVLGEPGSRFRINNGTWSHDDGYGNCRLRVSLNASINDFWLETTDIAGNSESVGLRVFYSPVVKPKDDDGSERMIVILVVLGMVSVIVILLSKKETQYKKVG